ncbi:hypothetical protein F5H01DRAFT_283206, partial [Linnemannia elongata]
LTDEDLETRLRYLTRLVYPAISEKSKESQDKMVARFNKAHKPVDFPNGTMAMARDERREGTTALKFEEPFMVGDRHHGNSYILLDGTGSPLTRRHAHFQLNEEKSSDSDATSESYEVEAILDHAQDEKNTHMYHYYVRWKGDGPEHNSWMPFTNFDNIQIARNYWRQQRKQLFPPYVLDNVSNKEQDSIKNKGTLNKRKRLTTDGTMPAQIASSSQIQDLRRSKRNRLYVFYFFLPYFSTSERK